MVKPIILATILSLFLIPEVSAQDKDPVKPGRNGVYADLYLARADFSDGFVSLNYERVIGKRQRTQLRVGLSPAGKYTGKRIWKTRSSWTCPPLPTVLTCLS